MIVKKRRFKVQCPLTYSVFYVHETHDGRLCAKVDEDTYRYLEPQDKNNKVFRTLVDGGELVKVSYSEIADEDRLAVGESKK